MTDDEPDLREKEASITLNQLERQMERASLFTHTALSNCASRINEVESFLYGLIDLLIEKGVVTPDEIAQTTEKVRQEVYEKGEMLIPGIALRADGDENWEENYTPIYCQERLHICKAVCCKLNFALSVEEVESGMIKWDLGCPYLIRRESTGYCTHINLDEKRCQIYPDRPIVCRKYSCANDQRIWKDFEKAELNEEWIAKNLGDGRSRLVPAMMHRAENVERRSVDPNPTGSESRST